MCHKTELTDEQLKRLTYSVIDQCHVDGGLMWAVCWYFATAFTLEEYHEWLNKPEEVQ